MRPVTTYRTQTVDQGCYVDAVTGYTPAQSTRPRLRWMPPTQSVDPATGQVITQRPGLGWVKTTTPPQPVTQKVWKPNLVSYQVPVTQMVPEQVTETVPVPSHADGDRNGGPRGADQGLPDGQRRACPPGAGSGLQAGRRTR